MKKINEKIKTNNKKYKLLSLNSAMLKDLKLKLLVKNFELETNEIKQLKLVNQILLRWTNTEKKYIKCETQCKQKVLTLFQIDIKNDNDIDAEYNKIKERIYAQLMKNIHLAEYYNLIITKNVMKYDLSDLVNKLKEEVNKNEKQGRKRIYQVYRMIENLGIIQYSNFNDKNNQNSFYNLLDLNNLKIN